MKDYRSLSLWLDSCGDDLTPREALPGDVSADVAIVGGGLTGLWAAHYLKSQAPDLRIWFSRPRSAGLVPRDETAGGALPSFPRLLSS